MQAPYLRISIGDSDFTSYFDVLAQAIYGLIEFHGFPKDTDQIEVTDDLLLRLKEPIAKLWNSIESVYQAFKGYSVTDHYPYILGSLRLSVVSYEAIDFDGAEGIYVALFKTVEGEHRAFLGR